MRVFTLFFGSVTVLSFVGCASVPQTAQSGPQSKPANPHEIVLIHAMNQDDFVRIGRFGLRPGLCGLWHGGTPYETQNCDRSKEQGKNPHRTILAYTSMLS